MQGRRGLLVEGVAPFLRRDNMSSDHIPNMQDYVDFGRVNGPKWPNGCDHPEGTYLTTFEVVERWHDGEIHEEIIDLYLYESNGRQEPCLRYGKEDSQYYSPMSMEMLIKSARHMEGYRAALKYLRKYGQLKWVSNPTKEGSVDA